MTVHASYGRHLLPLAGAVVVLLAVLLLTWSVFPHPVVLGVELVALLLVVLLVAAFGVAWFRSRVLGVAFMEIADDELRYPQLGVRVPWSRVIGARIAMRPRGARRPSDEVLVVDVVDPDAVVAQCRGLARSEVRTSLATYGAPLAYAVGTLDHPVSEVLAAVNARALASRQPPR